MSLMSAYSNDTRVTRDQLASYDVPAARGRFHNPISFYDYVNEVDEQLDRQGLQIDDVNSISVFAADERRPSVGRDSHADGLAAHRKALDFTQRRNVYHDEFALFGPT